MQLNKSASRVVDIIDLIAQSGKALTITEIGKTLNIPKSSTFDILYTLVEKGYLEIEDERVKTFKLGHRLFQAGISFLSGNSLYSAAHPFLEKLMLESEETVFLAVEDRGQLVYLDKVEQSSSVRTTIRLGFSKNPIYCSSLGKAILASFSDDQVKDIVGEERLMPVTENTVRTYHELIEQLNETRRRGFSIENGEGNPDVACVGAPIYDHSGKSIAAVSIASPKYRMNKERFEQLGELVSRTALSISRKIGFLEDRLYYSFKG